ncbi:B-cell receptor CD22-like isoform X3 [Cyclopterus lumpus]|uniref:B-cell receptor CD22-like isoform X3 n=2 Tax=Cyclopterus lumpus TaxID=8103 RepID=UPI001486F31C|nr:B-cell receptor CD22-like isoform X3 [Cyclopterus lumpus]
MGFTSGLVVLFLSVAAADCRRSWFSDHICGVKGSTVELRCRQPPPARRRSVPLERVTWFTETQDGRPVDLRADSEYAGRVKYYCDQATCTLRITDLRESDSAQYKFRFKNKRVPGGVTLSVTDPDLQVQVIRSDSASWARLFCRCSCHLPEGLSYVWHKNGQAVAGETSALYSDYFDPADGLSCAARGYEDFPSAPVCAVGRTCNRVAYADRSLCASEGSSVDISSTYDSHDGEAESAFWFSPERGGHRWRPEDLREDPRYEGRVEVVETERGRSTLRITGLRESDSAEYLFKFNTPSFEWRSGLPGTTLTVTALQLQVTRVTVHPSHAEAELRCVSGCRAAGRLSYVWFKNGVKSTSEESSALTEHFHPGDAVSCALKGHEESVSLPLYGPRLPSVSVSPSEIVEGSSVTLTCSSDANPAANYTWYKKNQPRPHGEEPQLVFSSIQSSDSGQYLCEAENHLGKKRSKFISIDVKYGPKLPSVSVSPSEIVEGSSVTLTCSSDANPAANYTWYKKNQPRPHGEEPQLVFSSIQSSDSGQYLCEAENHLGKKRSEFISIDVKYGPRLPSVSVSPSEIVEGSSVTLTCSSDANPAASYTWYKKNQPRPHGEEPQLVFSSIQSSDSGQYLCEAENHLGKKRSEFISIDVKYGPKLPSVSVSPSEIVEGSSVTLTCSSDANPAANYTWYKKNQPRPHGEEPQLVFSSIQSSDSGQYLCEAENHLGKKRSELISIDVKYGPKLPSVSVSPSEIVEGSSVTLTCSSDANPAASYTWYKKNQTGPHGEEPQLVFSSIQSSDSGQYLCEAENHLGTKRSKFISIDVKYGPRLPSVSVSPSEIVEGSSVTLTCSSDANPAANYTWYKKNQPRPHGEEPQLVFSSIQSSDSGQYLCEAENHLGKKRSEFISIDVKYGPKLPSVSVSPSEIVEGSSVTLTCSSDANPAANYTWYKKNQPRPHGEEPQLVFSSIQSSDSGQYLCEAENHLGKKRSEFISIDVKYGPRLPSVSVSPSEIVEGSSVTLSCSSDANPAANYTWYKKNQTSPHGEGDIYCFTSISSEDRGIYYCKAENQHEEITSSSLVIDVQLTTTISEMGPVWNESGINAKSKRMWLCISLRRKGYSSRMVQGFPLCQRVPLLR